jgi:hypothetical protein
LSSLRDIKTNVVDSETKSRNEENVIPVSKIAQLLRTNTDTQDGQIHVHANETIAIQIKLQLDEFLFGPDPRQQKVDFLLDGTKLLSIHSQQQLHMLMPLKVDGNAGAPRLCEKRQDTTLAL